MQPQKRAPPSQDVSNLDVVWGSLFICSVPIVGFPFSARMPQRTRQASEVARSGELKSAQQMLKEAERPKSRVPSFGPIAARFAVHWGLQNDSMDHE